MIYPNLKVGSKIKIHKHGNLYIPGNITSRRGDYITYESDDKSIDGGVSLKHPELFIDKIQFDKIQENKMKKTNTKSKTISKRIYY